MLGQVGGDTKTVMQIRHFDFNPWLLLYQLSSQVLIALRHSQQAVATGV